MDSIINNIPGLTLVPNFISLDTESQLIKYIDNSTCNWESLSNSINSRRVQHYGYKYDYKTRKLNGSVNPIPDIIKNVVISEIVPQQVIVNEYFHGQKIAAHIDATIFGPKICIISMLSDVVMVFRNGFDKVELLLPRRSLLILEDEARYEWTHEVTMSNTYKASGSRRVSITYRTVV